MALLRPRSRKMAVSCSFLSFVRWGCGFTLSAFSDGDEVSDFVPDLLDRVDRALELVSKLKQAEPPPKAAQPPPKAAQPAPKTAQPAPKGGPGLAPKGAPKGAPKPQARPLPGSKAAGDVKAKPSSRPVPALARPSSSGSSRVKPAHMTAPFLTNPNLPASNYRRRRPQGVVRRGKAPADPRQWLGDLRRGSEECTRAKNSREGAASPPKVAPSPPEALQSTSKSAVPRPAELRRSLSAESLQSPRREADRLRNEARSDFKAKL